VQTILEVQLTPPLHDVTEEVAEKRGLLVEKCLEIEGALGCDQVCEANLSGR
jgi:hypothetical protein